VLAEMRRDEVRSDVARSHEQVARCARCGFRDLCDQSLA
jgi:CRISPR-associated exonuclease Cas4